MAPVRSVSWILLTMGDRPGPLAAAVASIPAAPAGVAAEILVVSNGASGIAAPEPARLVELGENVGIPAGRNRGAEEATGDLLFFLDDDAVVADATIIGRSIAAFDADSRLAVISFRIADPQTGTTSRRHVPRVGAGGPDRSGPVTSFLGGACAIRASALHDVGGLAGEFFYALEETDLAWRLIDRGWRIHYDAESEIHHPRTDPARHGAGTRLTSRNRVLAARRCLPAPLVPIYVLTWLVITTIRDRSVRSLRDQAAGTRDGWRAHVDRRPIRWSTVWRLTRLGRPPVI